MHDFRELQNPSRFHWSDEFQKKFRTFFFGKSCSRDFGVPGCHPDTLIDLANIALASTFSREPISMASDGYRTHRGVTGPIIFKSRTFFFFGKTCSRDFGAPGCHPNTLFDLANTALAGRVSREPISMISECYRTHRGVTGPMNFKKSGRFFFGKSRSRDFGAPGCHPSTLIDLVKTALASTVCVETICMIYEG